jgi:hypothetical protein
VIVDPLQHFAHHCRLALGEGLPASPSSTTNSTRTSNGRSSRRPRRRGAGGARAPRSHRSSGASSGPRRRCALAIGPPLAPWTPTAPVTVPNEPHASMLREPGSKSLDDQLSGSVADAGQRSSKSIPCRAGRRGRFGRRMCSTTEANPLWSARRHSPSCLQTVRRAGRVGVAAPPRLGQARHLGRQGLAARECPAVVLRVYDGTVPAPPDGHQLEPTTP